MKMYLEKYRTSVQRWGTGGKNPSTASTSAIATATALAPPPLPPSASSSFCLLSFVSSSSILGLEQENYLEALYFVLSVYSLDWGEDWSPG